MGWIYLSMQNDWPALPFNWLDDRTNIVLYISPSTGTNVVWVGDLGTDYAQRAAEAEVLRLAARAASGRVATEAEFDFGGSAALNYSASDLWLELVSLTTNLTSASATLAIHAPAPSVFDVFFAPALPAADSHGW